MIPVFWMDNGQLTDIYSAANVFCNPIGEITAQP